MTSHASGVAEDSATRNPVGKVTTVLTVVSGVAPLVGAAIGAVCNLGNAYFLLDEQVLHVHVWSWRPDSVGEPGVLADA